jgi:hypothetical protein
MSAFPHHRDDPVTITRPALLLCMKSNRPWIPCGSRHHSTLEDLPGDDISRFTLAAQPHLLALIAAWRARHSTRRLPCLPSWVCLFGVIYSSQVVHILAMFPFLPRSGPGHGSMAVSADGHWQYHCHLVDSIPIQVVPDHHPQYQTVCRHRLRLAIACWTIQRHLLRLTTMFDEVRWPTIVQNADLYRDDLIRGAVSPKQSFPNPNDVKLVAVSLREVKRRAIHKVLEWKTKVFLIFLRRVFWPFTGSRRRIGGQFQEIICTANITSHLIARQQIWATLRFQQ